jgi:hypothetical protein
MIQCPYLLNTKLTPHAKTSDKVILELRHRGRRIVKIFFLEWTSSTFSVRKANPANAGRLGNFVSMSCALSSNSVYLGFPPAFLIALIISREPATGTLRSNAPWNTHTATSKTQRASLLHRPGSQQRTCCYSVVAMYHK